MVRRRTGGQDRVPELFGFNGTLGERFWTVYETMLFIKIHGAPRDRSRHLPLSPRDKKNQCALTRWRNAPIRAIFTANVNIHRASGNKKSVKSALMSGRGVYYPPRLTAD